MTQAAPTTAEQLQARVAHLNMIQAIITRLAGYSATLKNFSLTTAGAIVALTIEKGVPIMFAAAIGVVILFMILDAYYLAQERCFRSLYNDKADEAYDQAHDLSIRHPGVTLKQTLRALGSTSVWAFYLPIVIGIFFLMHKAPHVAAAAT